MRCDQDRVQQPHYVPMHCAAAVFMTQQPPHPSRVTGLRGAVRRGMQIIVRMPRNVYETLRLLVTQPNLVPKLQQLCLEVRRRARTELLFVFDETKSLLRIDR